MKKNSQFPRYLPKITYKANENFYRKLSKKERRQFRNNCKSTEGYKTMYFVFTEPVEYMSLFVGGFFDWNDTPEGHEYWENIQQRYTIKDFKKIKIN